MADTYLTRTQTTGDRQKMTWSFWIKISGSGGRVFNSINADWNNNYVSSIHFNTTGYLTVYNVDGSSNIDVRPSRLYRDKNAWYHIVIAMDTTQSTASDRIKIYTNGVQETSFVNTTYPPQNADNTQWNYNGNNLTIGKRVYDTAQYTDGIISHFHFIDGTTYTPSAFGETDSTTGEWKIKTDPSVTYGNNGFFIFKDGTNLSGSTVQDQSGKGNNFTAYGTLTKTEDSPSNVFATLNPLDNFFAQNTFSYGNTRQLTDNSRYAWSTSTLGMTSGKYYCEVRHSGNIGDNYPEIGIAGRGLEDTSTALGTVHNTVSYQYNGQILINGTASSFGSAYSSTAIIGIALDVTNSKIYFSLNGVWQGSGNPTTGANGKTITTASTVRLGAYFFAGGDYGNSSRVTFDWNFGNGYFNSTAISSAGTNASGNGIFEYDVPTGYTALSTKGLNL